MKSFINVQDIGPLEKAKHWPKLLRLRTTVTSISIWARTRRS